MAETDNQPFLPKYRDRDDEANRTDSEDSSRPQFPLPKAAKRRWKLLAPVVSHSLVFILTSILWIFLVPNPRLERQAAAAAAAAMPKPSPIMATHNHGGGGAHSIADQLAVPIPHSSAATHNITSNATLVTCGKSTAEAKEKGCHYDVLLNHYVPEQCRDREWVDEYKEDMSWQAYADKERTKKIPEEEMGAVDHYYTSTRDHVNHCVQLWRKQFLVLFEEKNIDTISASWGHTEHCSQFLMDVTDKMKEYWNEPILVEVGWASCWVREKENNKTAAAIGM